jgi:hypothetical protein
MSRQASFSVVLATLIVVPFGMQLVSAAKVLPNLERAVEQQCRTHDWPKEADQLHRDWCVANGYKI